MSAALDGERQRTSTSIALRLLGNVLIEVGIWTVCGVVGFVLVGSIQIMGGPDGGVDAEFDVSLGLYLLYHAVRRTRRSSLGQGE
jgi:hypothetical protein